MADIPTPANQESWLNTLTNFRTKAREFMMLFSDLKKRETVISRYPPEIQKKYFDLMTSGQKIKNNIQSVTQKVDQAWGWMKSTFGLGNDDLKGLGFVQFIPLAIVAAGITAMGKWLKDAYDQKRVFDSIDAQISRGVPADQAYSNAARLREAMKSSLIKVGEITPLILLLGGALWYMSRNRSR